MNTILRYLIALILMLSASSHAWAEDLMSIYRLAKNNDPSFRAAQQEYLAAKETKNQSFASFLPTLNLSGDYTRIEQDYSTTGKTSYTNKSYKLSLQQALYHHDFYVKYRQADYQEAQALAKYNNAAQDLIVRVADAYFQILTAIDSLTFSQAEEKAIAEQLHQTKQRFKVGLTAITDVHEAQSRNDQATAQTIAADNKLAVNRENLREIIGQYPTKLNPLSANVPLVTPEPNDITQWTEIAAKQSLSLLTSEKAMQIAQEEINLRRAGHYPSLDLIASKSHTETGGGAFVGITGKTTEETRIGVQLTVPIYQGGLVQSQTREAAYRYQQAREQYEQQRRTTDRLTRSAYLNVIANISQVRAYKQALKSTHTALEATEAGYQVGTRTAVDVLNSRREVYRAERDYASSRYTYIVETLRLQQAAGTLGEDDLLSINQWLQ